MMKNKYIEMSEMDSKNYFGHMLGVFKYFIKNVLQEPLENFKEEDGYDPDYEQHEGEFAFVFEHEGYKYSLDIFNNIDVLGHNVTLYTPTEDILSVEMRQYRNEYQIKDTRLQTIFSFDLNTLEVKEIFIMDHHNLTGVIRETSNSMLDNMV